MTNVCYHDDQQQKHHYLFNIAQFERLKQDIIKRLKAAASTVSRPPPALEKTQRLVVENLIVSHTKSRRMYCRCTLIVRTTTGRVKWDGNQFHLPNDLSKEIRDKGFRSFNRGNQSQIKKKQKQSRASTDVFVCFPGDYLSMVLPGNNNI